MAYFFYVEYAIYFIFVNTYSCHNIIKFDTPITFNLYHMNIESLPLYPIFVIPYSWIKNRVICHKLTQSGSWKTFKQVRHLFKLLIK